MLATSLDGVVRFVGVGRVGRGWHSGDCESPRTLVHLVSAFVRHERVYVLVLDKYSSEAFKL